jgi:hypothetical protein
MHPKFLCEDVQGNNRLFAKPTHRWKKDLKVCPMEIKDEGVVLGQLAEDRIQRWAFVARLLTFEFQKELLIPKLRAVPLCSLNLSLMAMAVRLAVFLVPNVR